MHYFEDYWKVTFSYMLVICLWLTFVRDFCSGSKWVLVKWERVVVTQRSYPLLSWGRSVAWRPLITARLVPIMTLEERERRLVSIDARAGTSWDDSPRASVKSYLFSLSPSLIISDWVRVWITAEWEIIVSWETMTTARWGGRLTAQITEFNW